MKKTLTTLFLAFSVSFSFGQNVGINTPIPQTSLDVKGGFRTQPLYLTGSGTSIIIPDNQSNINLAGTFSGPFVANITNPQDGQRLTIDNNSNQVGALNGGSDIRNGINEYIHSDGEWKTLNTNAWGLNGNNNTNPATNFIGTTDKRDLVFKTFNDEKMRLHQQGGLSIGTITHTEALDLNGNANISGEIMPLGVAGDANQVLTSNGNGTMSWANSNNNVRFAARFLRTSLTSVISVPLNFLYYNLNTSSVSLNVAANTFTINKTGLYHFDFDIFTNASTGVNPLNYPTGGLEMYINATPYSIVVGNFQSIRSNNDSWIMQGSKSVDIHIVAPASISFINTISSFSSGIASIELKGHLINE